MLKTMCSAGYWPYGWRAERQDDDGRREQPGNSLKGPFHAMSPFGEGAGQVMTHRLPVLKRGFCVSIVSGRDSGSVAVVAGCIYLPRAMARPKIIIDDLFG